MVHETPMFRDLQLGRMPVVSKLEKNVELPNQERLEKYCNKTKKRMESFILCIKVVMLQTLGSSSTFSVRMWIKLCILEDAANKSKLNTVPQCFCSPGEVELLVLHLNISVYNKNTLKYLAITLDIMLAVETLTICCSHPVKNMTSLYWDYKLLLEQCGNLNSISHMDEANKL